MPCSGWQDLADALRLQVGAPVGAQLRLARLMTDAL